MQNPTNKTLRRRKKQLKGGEGERGWGKRGKRGLPWHVGVWRWVGLGEYMMETNRKLMSKTKLTQHSQQQQHQQQYQQ